MTSGIFRLELNFQGNPLIPDIGATGESRMPNDDMVVALDIIFFKKVFYPTL